jgi:hypothetical protein
MSLPAIPNTEGDEIAAAGGVAAVEVGGRELATAGGRTVGAE